MGDLTGNSAAAHAFNRFGLGGRPDEPIPDNPPAWLNFQLTCQDRAPVKDMPTVAQGLKLIHEATLYRDGSAEKAKIHRETNALFNSEVTSHLHYAITTTIPFRERLIWFWQNHFAIMAGSVEVSAVAGVYVRDAIRPHITGTITDMLIAVINHPAMIYSLDAQTSIGPDSSTGQLYAKQGLWADINENLARETLELYTVGTAAGYAQADVDALAYLLTGLNINVNPGAPRSAFYDVNKQQPGSFSLLGQNFPGTKAGLTAALTMLGTHPFTYQHLATELVAHFTADTPAQSDIDTVTQAFASSGGSLLAAHQAILGLASAWVPLTKLRTPLEHFVAVLRAANGEKADMPDPLLGCLNMLGEPLWQPPFPNGWSDQATDWAGPEPMLLRGDFATSQAAAILAAGVLSFSEIGDATVAPLLSSQAQTLLAALTTPLEQLACLFLSPAFQRR